MNYYNDKDKFACAWLEELIKASLIPDGVVDSRSILDVDPMDLKGFTQCHFFAGIGGWSYALKLAGFPTDIPVWTGSPPCQPFSVAGKKQGQKDERHLAPHFLSLIKECKPPIIFGEQVAAAIRFGWWDELQANLEAQDYACGMALLPAAGFGAPHRRERLFFVAMGDSFSHDLRGKIGRETSPEEIPEQPLRAGRREVCRNSLHWSNSREITARDGKRRLVPVESEIQLVVNGLPNRVDLQRGAGNAIVPQVAAHFISSVIY